MSGQTSTSTTNPFGPKPFGTTKSFRSPTGTSILGGMSTGVFGQPSTPAFGASSAPAFGSSMPSFGASSAPAFGSSPFGDSSLFGQNSSFRSFGSSPSQSNPFRSTFQQTQPSFGNDLFGSVSQFSTPSQPAFGSNTTSAFGLVSTPSFGTSPTFGASSTPAFGSTMTPVFAASSTPAFGSTTTSTFGSTSTSLFGNTGSSFGVSSFPAFGSTPTVSFGTPSTPTFGSSNTPAFGASTAFAFGTPTVFGFGALSSPSFSLGSTPSFGQSASAFGSTPFGALPSPFSIQSSPFGAQTTIPTFGSPSFGQPALWSQPGGTRVAPYSPTPEIDGGTSYHPFGILESISAIPVYKDKSHEELRWEHYQRGDKGGPNPFEQSATPINLATSSQPSLFGPTINQLLAGAQATSLFGFMIYQLLKGAQATTPYSPSFGQPDLWSQSRGTSIAPYSRTPEIDGGTNNQPDLWSQPRGTSIAPYSPTPEIDGDTNNQPFHKLESITAIPVYKNKSHEELRWEDYQRGDKGAQATTPTFGSPSFRLPSLWSQPGGTRVSPYSPTPEIDDGTSNQPFGKLESICAIPLYKDKSHEELRWEDYQRGDKGRENSFVQSINLATLLQPSLLQPTFGSPSFRLPSLWSQPGGTRVSPYSPTPEIDDGTSNQPFGKLESICAIPLYKDKSHEELRWEDYQRGDKGAQATTPTFGSPSFRLPSLWSQPGGTRVSPYSPTPEIDDGTSNQPFGKLESICAIPLYKDKSHEELRWEDYQRGDKGEPNPLGQPTPVNLATSSQPSLFGSTAIFGQSVANPFSSSSSNPFALKSPSFGSSSFGLASTSLFSSPFTTKLSNPFGSNSSTTSLFGAPTGSSFAASSSSLPFGRLTTVPFGSSTSLFGSAMAGSVSALGTGLAFGNNQSYGMFRSIAAPLGQTSSLFGQSSTGFQHTTSAFGSSLFSNQSSTFGGSLFSSSTPSLFPSSAPPGFGPTAISFQEAPSTQTTSTFSFTNLGQTSPASPSGFGSTSYIFSQGVNRPMRLTRCQKKLLPTRSSKVEVQGKNSPRGSLSPNIVSSET